jgi:ribose-phosphate pyrophosphokinase
MIITFKESEPLARKVAEFIGDDVSIPIIRSFADGEIYVRLKDGVKNTDAILLASLFPEPNHSLVRTLLACDALKRGGARSITVILTYFAYARQDRAGVPGESISAAIVGSSLRSAGADNIMVVEAHSENAVKELGAGAFDIDVTDTIGSAVKNLIGKVDFVVAPDHGVLGKCKKIARSISADICSFSKYRDPETGAITATLDGNPDLKGKTVVFVDDMISTGGSLAKAAEVLATRNVHTISAICVHPLMVGNAAEKLQRAGISKIYGSDTIQCTYTGYSVAEDIARSLKNWKK